MTRQAANDDAPIVGHGLLAADEPPPYECLEAAAPRPVVLTCDHAGRHIPRALGTLGVPEEYLDDHIAWDIGAGPVTRHLTGRLGAIAVLARYSRLVVDVNRSLADASAIPALSDGVLIPGNVGLGAADRAPRVDALYRPYHAAVDRALAGRTTAQRVPVLVAIHSFTPYLHTVPRPWQIGVLWENDPRLPLALMAELRRAGVRVGDNEPYSGRHPADYTIDHHAEPAGIAHAGIEIRQDLIDDEAGCRRWADILGTALERVLADERLYRPRVV